MLYHNIIIQTVQVKHKRQIILSKEVNDLPGRLQIERDVLRGRIVRMESPQSLHWWEIWWQECHYAAAGQSDWSPASSGRRTHHAADYKCNAQHTNTANSWTRVHGTAHKYCQLEKKAVNWRYLWVTLRVMVTGTINLVTFYTSKTQTWSVKSNNNYFPF